MVRGRATVRGRGRGAAAAPAAGSQPTESDSQSSTPQPTASSGPSRAPGARGGTTARAARGATARFRPKNIRRDEAERDAMAREEEARANARAAAAQRARGRSRLRSKRSRGDAMGSRGGRTMTASGPFSSGMASGSGSGGGGGWGGGFGGGGGGGGGFASSSGGAGGRGVKGSKSFNMLDGDSYQEPRINADKLHNASIPDDEFNSDDEAMRATLSSRGATIIPMGIYRKEHKEQGIVVATTAELEAAEASGNVPGEEESLFVEDTRPPTPDGDEPEESAKIKIKEEDTGVKDLMELDETPDVADSKEAISEAKTIKVLPTDPEEKMIQSDLNLLASELGAVTVSDEDQDATANKDGRLYLFQFPPLLPPLKAIAPESTEEKVKAEPAEDRNMAEAPPANGEAFDLTAEQGQEADDEDDPEADGGFMSRLLSHGGMVGKLNVRKSGRVELDWGGTPMEMSPATAMNFLTTAVIVEESDEKPSSDAPGGDSIGMGKIMGRFVLAPVWEDEEEYEIPPGALDVEA